MAFLAALAGCASSEKPAAIVEPQVAPPAAAAEPSGGYVGGVVALECAPFARAVSGVNLKGAAGAWWQAAAGRYNRTASPVVGSVLAFRRSSRLPDGHVAVVSRLVSDREILVTQANWIHHRVTADLPVVDISSANDWSMVRVWWPPSSQLGSTHYPTWGFIVPERPPSHDQQEAAVLTTIGIAPGD
ncbi:CHAP domain-containing protein [Telmatospirillum sp.]|uniref:CHAP domain-containing protein n=1 Tax=Telmatospirillum sp. TaxID=2079197 RepID=UPI00284DA3A3|nr:CHAP domain-containing protein [Telmatospirillum sp.]MDR3437918.1 CHAP domain-containing protein [Telmatospirillum sp.]